MVTSCALAGLTTSSAVLYALFLVALWLRIGTEKAFLLRQDYGYGEYVKSVCWRLVPYVW